VRGRRATSEIEVIDDERDVGRQAERRLQVADTEHRAPQSIDHRRRRRLRAWREILRGEEVLAGLLARAPLAMIVAVGPPIPLSSLGLGSSWGKVGGVGGVSPEVAVSSGYPAPTEAGGETARTSPVA